MSAIRQLLEIMKALRDPDTGCPWDRRQTMQSIVPHSLEEIYELADAIERSDMEDVQDELGDLLFHIIFYSQLASEAGCFDFEAVVRGVCEKLRRRHPHVFADRQVNTREELNAVWEKIKQAERAAKNRRDGDDPDPVPAALPALLRALKLQKRAALAGFDWQDPAAVIPKVEEELDELRQALAGEWHSARLRDEIGDLLFSVINLARHLDIHPEVALRETNRKFERRFRFMREALEEQGQTLASASAEKMEELWEQAKISLEPGRAAEKPE